MEYCDYSYLTDLPAEEIPVLQQRLSTLRSVIQHSHRSYLLVDRKYRRVRFAHLPRNCSLTPALCSQCSEEALLDKVNDLCSWSGPLPWNEATSCILDKLDESAHLSDDIPCISMAWILSFGTKSRVVRLSYSLMEPIIAGDSTRWLLVSSTHIIDKGALGQIIFRQGKCRECYDYVTKMWGACEEGELPERIHHLLVLSLQGYTEDEIARELCVSKSAVKSLKRSLYRQASSHSLSVLLARMAWNDFL